MALSNLTEDLPLSDDQRVQPAGYAHQVPNGVVAGQHEEVLPERRNRKVGPLGEVFCNPGGRLPGVGGSVIDFEAVTGGKDGRLLDASVGTDLLRGGVPVGLGNGELLTNLDGSMMDGQADAVNLKSLGRSLETFLCSLVRVFWWSREQQHNEKSVSQRRPKANTKHCAFP